MNTILAQQIANEGGVEAWMIAQQHKSLLRFLTCGSVDDGKSTLIGRLLHDTLQIYEDQLSSLHNDSKRHGTQGEKLDLALLVDGLQAEREQGITIDVAYRYFSTEKRKFIIADTPGHEQYTRNMATGASTCDLAILLIDARKGVLDQTRRHSFISTLLGIKHLVVAINKMDLVDYCEETFARIVTFDGDKEEACAGEAITLVLNDDIDISRGDLLLAANETLAPARHAAIDVVWMAEQPLAPGQSYDVKLAGKKTRARIEAIRYQVDINNLTQRDVESLPLNGIGLVEMTFDEPLALDIYQQNPVTGGLIFIDRLSNVTVGAGMVRELDERGATPPVEYSAFELELNALVRRHFPHWDARDLLGDKHGAA